MWHLIYIIFLLYVTSALTLIFPSSNATHIMWYYSCLVLFVVFFLQSAYILFYMAIVGHALSIASLLISLAIFFYFR